MKVTFIYEKSKDVWCLLNKGKNSNNSLKPTKQYELLVKKYGESPTTTEAADFVGEYILKNKLNIFDSTEQFTKDWENVSVDFHKRAEAIFGISLPCDVVGYLTINSRCPYDIQDMSFYISLQSSSARVTVMHELWHFYTWFTIGSVQEKELGFEKYNALKEALTVLINVECKDLLPEGNIDVGYPQHQEKRNLILEHWENDKNIHNLWNFLCTQN